MNDIKKIVVFILSIILSIIAVFIAANTFYEIIIIEFITGGIILYHLTIKLVGDRKIMKQIGVIYCILVIILIGIISGITINFRK